LHQLFTIIRIVSINPNILLQTKNNEQYNQLHIVLIKLNVNHTFRT